jgi:hypothetical protein
MTKKNECFNCNREGAEIRFEDGDEYFYAYVCEKCLELVKDIPKRYIKGKAELKELVSLGIMS